MQHLSKTALAAASFALYSLPSLAQGDASLINVLPGSDTLRAQQQRLEANATNGTLGNVLREDASREETADLAHLPVQSPCFEIRKVRMTNNPFRAIDRLVEAVEGQCVGADGLKIVQDSVANKLIDYGYVTTRVTVPEQSLTSGTLQLDVVPGRIGAIRSDGDTIGDVARALPSGQGALLNQRAIDQALENIRRLPSQADARFDIARGDLDNTGGTIAAGRDAQISVGDKLTNDNGSITSRTTVSGTAGSMSNVGGTISAPISAQIRVAGGNGGNNGGDNGGFIPPSNPTQMTYVPPTG
ncbi:POTRA domain-containing protein [Paraburkholderia phytofirmans]|uniref:POTRA domain-containing protein n=1 Tax=Paraburkholderia phytofirmans TaxID=261302 RepID=UPI0038B8708B